MNDKVKSFLKPPAASDDFDIDALDGVDFETVTAEVENKRSGGGVVIEASDECEGGGCKI